MACNIRIYAMKGETDFDGAGLSVGWSGPIWEGVPGASKVLGFQWTELFKSRVYEVRFGERMIRKGVIRWTALGDKIEREYWTVDGCKKASYAGRGAK